MLKLLFYEILWIFKRAFHYIFKRKIRNRHYAGSIVLNHQDGNDFLREQIHSGRIFMCCRVGAVELSLIKEQLEKNAGLRKKISDSIKWNVRNNAGFFDVCGGGRENDYSRLVDEYIRGIKAADIIGVWYNPLEDYFIKQYGTDYKLIHREVFDFWEYAVPWTSALKGKKVLVVHPFEKTIINQYKKRRHLFNDENYLPEFDLITVRAIQTSAGENCEHENWFDALEAMFNSCMEYEFDIALIGCGAYGLPLAAKLKYAGKVAIHVGGVLQMLFGIKGHRWDEHPTASKLYNNYWVRPLPEETPKENRRVENGCYW